MAFSSTGKSNVLACIHMRLCTNVLCGVLEDYIIKSGSSQNSRLWSLDHFLFKNKSEILSNPIGRKNEDILYPGFGVETDIGTWSQYLLIFVILEFCLDQTNEDGLKEAIENLRDRRQRLFYKLNEEISDDDFQSLIAEVRLHINRICETIQNDELLSTADEEIQRALSGTDITNGSDFIIDLVDNHTTEKGLRIRIERLPPENHELREYGERTVSVLQQLDLRDVEIAHQEGKMVPPRSVFQPPDLEIEIQLDNNDTPSRCSIEELVRILNEGDTRPGDVLSNEDIEIIRQIMQRSFSTLGAVTARQGCIRLHLHPKSVNSLFQAVEECINGGFTSQFKPVEKILRKHIASDKLVLSVVLYKEDYNRCMKELVKKIHDTLEELKTADKSSKTAAFSARCAGENGLIVTAKTKTKHQCKKMPSNINDSTLWSIFKPVDQVLQNVLGKGVLRLSCRITNTSTGKDEDVRENKERTLKMATIEHDQSTMGDEVEIPFCNQPETTLYSRVQASPKENDEYTRPGKPISTYKGSDFIVLSWDAPMNFQYGNFYQVSMKEIDQNIKWKIYNKEFSTASGNIEDIKSNTKFVFRVRVVYEHGVGLYSPESDVVITFSSPASQIVDYSTKVKGEHPAIYALPVTEINTARDVTAKSRQFSLGSPPLVAPNEKTIMLIGETGTGKSTLVDGFVNYILGVYFNDAFRYTILDLEENEKQRETYQALSQTEWITRYTIFPEEGSRVPYCLNIIDTPGFGDTRGQQRDQEIVERIRQVFSAKHPTGVCEIDAICFLIKTPGTRLTSVQSHILQSIISLFGKDVVSNICSFITFVDVINTEVHTTLKESNLPFDEYFIFNNYGLFARNVGHTRLVPMFWEMGMESFKHFFSRLEQGKPKSLQLTKDAIDERFRLEQTVKNLKPQIDAGLQKVNQLKQEISFLIDRNKSTIKNNACLTYEVDEPEQKKTELPSGQHVTYCPYCNFTCHANCGISDDGRIKECIAMDDNGYCTVCPNKCKWDKHANTPYIFNYITVKVKKNYAEMKKKYEEAF